MFAASNVSVREKVLLAASASLLAVLCACATVSPPQPAPAPESAVISELQVENEGAATVVSLLGLVEPVYTAFQQDDPARIEATLWDSRAPIWGSCPGAPAGGQAILDRYFAGSGWPASCWRPA